MGGLAILAGELTGNSASDVAETQAGAQNNATAQAREMYDLEVERMKPFYEAGKAQIPTFEQFLKTDYQPKGLGDATTKYELQTGTKALNRALSARGLSGSGNAANRMAELEMGVAARGEGREYQRWQDQYAKILDALKLGTGASGQMGSASNTLTQQTQQGAQNLGNIAANQGANQASLYGGLTSGALNTAALGIKGYQAYNAGTPTTTSKAPSFYQAEDYEYQGGS